MGRPRGKGKKSAEAASSDDDGSGGGGGGSDEAAPTYKRSERPQKPLKDNDTDGVDDIATAEEDGDDVKPIVPRKGPKSSVEGSRVKKRRRRRRRQVKGSSDSFEEDGKDGEHAGAKSNGFRRNGSRRKSTPRRAAEAGVECK